MTPSLLRVNKYTQQEALSNSRNSTKENNSFFCSIEYDPTNPPIQEWIKELWPVLYRSSGTHTLIDQDIVFGHRKPKSLHTDIFGNSNKKNSTPKYKRRMCRYCPHIDRTSEVTSNSTGRKYRSTVNVTCNSSNLIHMIECTFCVIQYVGQTKIKILIWMNQYYSSNKKRLETLVSRHFNSHSFKGFYPVRIYILTLIREDADSIEGSKQKNKSENYWMARLYSSEPKGLNIKDKIFLHVELCQLSIIVLHL